MNTYSFENFSDFLKSTMLLDGKIHQLLQENRHIFRGQSSAKLELIPSALREGVEKNIQELAAKKIKVKGPHIEDIVELKKILNIPENDDYMHIIGELYVLFEFFKSSDQNGLKTPYVKEFNENFSDLFLIEFIKGIDTWLPQELYELAGLAQHHGVPTRLLDWTRDIFIALYFATTGALKNQENNSNVDKDNIVIYILDTKYIIDNETPLKLIKPMYYANPNLAAQKGLFTLWEKNIFPQTNINPNTPLDKLVSDDNSLNGKQVISKIEIPCSEAKKIIKYLKTMHYDSARVFPGHDGVVKKMNHNKYLFDR